jgi:2-C-methyl-D-erythritol 4-phosphate cytidylyltransferase
MGYAMTVTLRSDNLSSASSDGGSFSTPSADARCFALLPCAGSGSRAGTVGPKQYELVAGRPLVVHTLQAFAAVMRLCRVLVVVAPGDNFLPVDSARVEVADCGGTSRAASVFNGVNHLLAQGAWPHDWVLVHDAARCLITPMQINALIDACHNDTVGGLLALKLPDTLKVEQGGRVAATVDRGDKWLAQTPQMFRLGTLQAALADAAQQGFAGITDEASAIEATGLRPLLVPGSAQNFKVTYPEDFALADAILRSRP